MEKMDLSIQKEYLGGWLSQLTERDQQILSLRFGLGGEEPLTLAAIGRHINVSRERVRQLESKALSNLKFMAGHVLISKPPLAADQGCCDSFAA
jgi:RNA polymerase primary sigma factor